MRGRSESGISLIEIVVVSAIAAVMMTIAAPSVLGFVRGARADGALAAAENAMRVARERAIAERRNFEVAFVGADVIRVSRVEIPGPAKTIVSEARLEDGLRFLLASGVPDTPDKFGKATATAFGASPARMFTSEGTFVDNVGDPLNGTLFLSVPNEPASARAITVLGATALIRGWRWNGQAWTN